MAFCSLPYETDIPSGNGMQPAEAETVDQCLVAADLRGIDTHGCIRLPSFMERMGQGVFGLEVTPSLTRQCLWSLRSTGTKALDS